MMQKLYCQNKKTPLTAYTQNLKVFCFSIQDLTRIHILLSLDNSVNLVIQTVTLNAKYFIPRPNIILGD
jgi:hypothetical protein